MAGHEGPPAVHRDGDPEVRLVRSRGSLLRMVVGSRMRERRKSGSERGRGSIVSGKGVVRDGWGASLTNTRGAGGGSPARPAKNSGSTRTSPATRGPALLALTAPAQAMKRRS